MHRLQSVFALVALAVTCSGVLAQAPSADVANYPERMVRIIVPFSAGSMTDMRALAVTGAKRLTGLPDIPTFKEAGVPEFEYDSWFGILAPAGTPRAIVAKVSADIGQSLQAADVKSRFEPQGMVLISSTPEKFDAVIKADTERYSKIIKPAS
jgi:tripartite-type tricarboxylate transporter receptor subunit TctC